MLNEALLKFIHLTALKHLSKRKTSVKQITAIVETYNITKFKQPDIKQKRIYFLSLYNHNNINV